MYRLKVFSVVNQAFSVLPKVKAVNSILQRYGYDHEMRVDPLWFGWPSKLINYIDMVRNLDKSYTHVMFVDGADVMVMATPDEVMSKFFEFEHPWVYNAEPHIWSPGSFKPEDYPTPQVTYRYLNSGACIGERKHILKWYEIWTEGFTKDPDCIKGDQDWVAERYIRHYPDAIKLDTNCELFQTGCGSRMRPNPILKITPGLVYNKETNTFPMIIHANGGDDITSEDWRILWNHQ
jgi:hypothetical protein